MIWLPVGRLDEPAVAGDRSRRGEHYVRMEGSETYRFATKTLASSALTAIERAGWTPEEVDLFIPHQANVRIIESVAKGLGLPMEKMFVNVDRYGNTSAASVPHRARRGGRLRAASRWRQDRARRLRRGLHVGRGGHRVDGRSAARPAGRRRSCRCASVRAAVDWDSVDPMPPRGWSQCWRHRRAADVPLDDVVPGEPAPCPSPAKGGGRRDRPAARAAVVTGGSRGIGRAIALRLARAGRRRRVQLPRQRGRGDGDGARSRRFGRKALAVQGDVTRPGGRRGARSRPRSTAFGKIDILVNNAGITRDDLIMRMSLDDWRDVLETNLFGAFYAIKAVTRPMLKAQARPDHQHHQRLGPGRPDGPGELLVGEGRADRPDQGHGARAGQSAASPCNAVAPGFVLTELTQDLPDAIQTSITADAARPLRHARGGRRRRRVPRVRRGGVHHRPGARRRRRPGDDVTECPIAHLFR